MQPYRDGLFFSRIRRVGICVWACLCACLARAEDVTRTWQADVDYAQTVDPELQPLVGPYGAPQVLERIVLIDIPSDATFTRLTYEAAWTVYQTNVCPNPVTPPVVEGAAAPEAVRDAAYFGCDTWPETPVVAAGELTMGGVRRLRVRVRPFRWRGTTWAETGRGVLEAATSLRFTVVFTVHAGTARARTASRARSAVGTSGVDLEIIAPPDLFAAWEGYATNRLTMRPDLSIRVTGTDTIYSKYPFGDGLANRNAAESIHAHIRASAATGTSHFLLGGMWLDAQTPATNVFFRTGERLSLSNCVPGVCAQFELKEREIVATPSDLFYACLDNVDETTPHPWDPDGDGLYLETNEVASCDCVADVAVGRFAPIPYAYDGTGVLSMAQLIAAYADKVARGEGADFAGAGTLGVASAVVVTTVVNRADAALGRPFKEMTFFDDVPNLWQSNHVGRIADAEYTARETVRTCIVPYWPVRAVESVHESAPAFAFRYGTWTKAQEGYYAADMVYAMCRAHGSVQQASVFTRNKFAQTTGLSLFNDFCLPCHTGQIDYWLKGSDGRMCVEPALGLVAIVSPTGGALAGVHNVRDGLISTFESATLKDGYSQTVSYYLARRLFISGDATFGEAFLHARQEYVASYGTGNPHLYVLGEQFFYGDPTIRLPEVPKVAAFDETTAFTQSCTVVTATVSAVSSARLDGPAAFKVMETLTVSATNLVCAAPGGVGRKIAFATNDVPGRLELTGDAPFYLGGLAHGARVDVRGSGKILNATGFDATFQTLTIEGTDAAAETNVWRTGRNDTRTGRIDVARSTLCAEAIDLSGDGRSYWLRPVYLSDATLCLSGAFAWGRKRGSVYQSFVLDVAGTSTVCAVASTDTRVTLVGTNIVRVAADAALTLDVPFVESDNGTLLLEGAGVVTAARMDALAGVVEVASNVTLAVAASPLSVRALIVRTGATLQLPVNTTGVHRVVADAQTLWLEDGARVQDATGRVLSGMTANGVFYEKRIMRYWKGGTGVWSDPAGWSGGAWANGCMALFKKDSTVSNDWEQTFASDFVFQGNVTISGSQIDVASKLMSVPSNCQVRISAPLGVPGDLIKKGPGALRLDGEQPLLTGGIRVEEGTLELADVRAENVTNLSAAVGSRLLLRGTSSLTNAAACNCIAANALACADGVSAATLEVRRFAPWKNFLLPSNVTLRVDTQGSLDFKWWTAVVDGTLDWQGRLCMMYGNLSGTGTVRTRGLFSQASEGAGWGTVRLALIPGVDGTFPIDGNQKSNASWFRFNGTTIGPCGGDVELRFGGLQGGIGLLVEAGGVTFDTLDTSQQPAVGRTLVFGAATVPFGFGGVGDVVKVGAGTVRFAWPSVDSRYYVLDQHTGRTIVRQGCYAVETYTATCAFDIAGAGQDATVELAVDGCTADITLGAGGTLDLSDEWPTYWATTNFTWSSRSTVKLTLGPDGGDVIDVRGGTCVWPADGTATLDVSVARGTPPGVYPILLTDTPPPAGQIVAHIQSFDRSARLIQNDSQPGFSVLVSPLPTVILFR